MAFSVVLLVLSIKSARLVKTGPRLQWKLFLDGLSFVAVTVLTGGGGFIISGSSVRHQSDIDYIVCCTRRSFQEGYVCAFLEYYLLFTCVLIYESGLLYLSS